MRPVAPVGLFTLDQLHPGLIDQRSRLQGVSGPFTGKLEPRQALELGIDARAQFFPCALIAGRPPTKRERQVRPEITLRRLPFHILARTSERAEDQTVV